MASVALYLEIYQKIMRDIQSGEYPENTMLPSERELCEKYHVSRSTIRSALEVLKKTDTVYSVQGNGTYIKPFVYVQNLTSFYSFTESLKKSNVVIQNTVVNYTSIFADDTLAAETGYPIGTAFHKLLRLRSARHYPLMLETTYLPINRFLDLDLEALEQGSLYDYLRQKYAFHVDKAVETFRPVMPRPEEKTLLHISSGTPCTLLERFSYEGNTLTEYTKSIVRGDKYIFRSELMNQEGSSTSPTR